MNWENDMWESQILDAQSRVYYKQMNSGCKFCLFKNKLHTEVMPNDGRNGSYTRVSPVCVFWRSILCLRVYLNLIKKLQNIWRDKCGLKENSINGKIK